MSEKIRTRIAPSPTGFAHMGNAYTALFNWAFAKKQKGWFIVRIEDTDIKRNVKGAEDVVFEALSWLLIDHDESLKKPGKLGPYRQSEKLARYNEAIEDLLKKDLAYEDEGAVRFKNPGEKVSWQDVIKGEVSFPGGEITDFVIRKSDGYPTYNFAVVIDDIDMGITHVIRGDEHVSNTPRQLVIYKALGKTPPKFAHLPTIRNEEHKKLSKRHDNVDINYYKKEGFLPEALINYLALLGWSHPEGKEIFDAQEFIDVFSLDRVRSAGPIFDINKLTWLNGEYIRKMDDKKLVKTISDFYEDKFEKALLEKTTPLIKERINKINEYENLAGFFYKSPKVDKKLLGKNYKENIKLALLVFEESKSWEGETIGSSLVEKAKKNNIKVADLFMNLRIAVTGKKVTPPFNESIEILGRDETVKRLKEVL